MRTAATRVLTRRQRCNDFAARHATSLASTGRQAAQSAPASQSPARVYANPFLSSSHARDADNNDATEPLEPLLSLSPSYELFPNDVHCFLGLNGSGKSRFLRELQQQAAAQASQQQQQNRDTSQDQPRRPRCRIASLSLDAHRKFVAQHGDRVVADVLGGVGSPSARDLIVRLGLFPVWESRVRHLSTGEMRKLLLAETLLAVPRANILILDQPFDGLDVAARKQLEWMLGQLTRGFTRLLVDTGGRNDAFAYRTQVLLVANRVEQVFPEILTHMVLMRTPLSLSASSSEALAGMTEETTSARDMTIVPYASDQATDVSHTALFAQLETFFDEEQQKRPAMPHDEIVAIVRSLFDCAPAPMSADSSSSASGYHGSELSHVPAVALRQVSIAYDRRVLLDGVDFVRARHEHWVLLGPNGSGKSSLMRVLLQAPGHGLTSGDVFIGSDKIERDGQQQQQLTQRVGAISTDQHIHLLHESVSHRRSDDANSSDALRSTAFDLIAATAKSRAKALVAAELLRLSLDVIASRSLAELSQGEQKLVLIAKTLAACPEVLILDEITHGLDPFNRAHVLNVVNAIGEHAHAATHLILITHHDDEIVACFGDRVFEIRDKQLVARGSAAQ